MDTKLKNYRYSNWLKFFAIILCVAGMLTLAYGLLKAPYFEYAFQNSDFKASNKSKDIFNETFYNVSNIAFLYKNEENIKSGAAINEDELNSRTAFLLNEKESALMEIEHNYNESIQRYTKEGDTSNSSKNSQTELFTYPDVAIESRSDTPETNTVENNFSSEMNNNQIIDVLKKQKNSKVNQINKKYDDLIKNIKTKYINEQLSDYHSQVEYLNKNDGVFYTVVEDGKITLSNLVENQYLSEEEFYSVLPLSSQLNQSNVSSFFTDYYYHYETSSFPSNAVVFMGLSQEKYNDELAIFNQNAKEGLLGLKISSIGLLVFLLSLFYMIYAAGRRVDLECVHLVAVDFIYLDVALVLSVASIALCLAPFFEFGRYLFTEKNYMNNNLILIVFGIIIAIGTLLGILFVTMFSKRAKRHEILRHTLIFKLCNWVIGKIKILYDFISLKINSVFDKSPLAIRLVLIFGAYAFIILISLLLFFAGFVGFLIGFTGLVGVNVLAIYYLLKTFKTLKDIKEGAERIRTGELSYNIPEQGVPELRQLAHTINKIADGLKYAVSRQVKAERMKAELITNVSHDLKTPLTSIITYVDLIKTEGLQSENAEKYLGIIDTKSQRLKALTEDLFEAAKATSGNISVNLERLDVASLINQGIGELSDKIEASGLNFRTNLPSEKLFVLADGKLLWRVMENLLSNVFKYALPNSRVYIDATTTGENALIIIKNISAYELNIKEDELMERFKRGDASRHSEGSGLGLSIAKSLTELQGGNFHIEIDGDLFKATIELPNSGV